MGYCHRCGEGVAYTGKDAGAATTDDGVLCRECADERDPRI